MAVAKARLKEIRDLFYNFAYRRRVACDAAERQTFSQKIKVLLLTVQDLEVSPSISSFLGTCACLCVHVCEIIVMAIFFQYCLVSVCFMIWDLLKFQIVAGVILDLLHS
jgi:hypothetical protein